MTAIPSITVERQTMNNCQNGFLKKFSPQYKIIKSC